MLLSKEDKKYIRTQALRLREKINMKNKPRIITKDVIAQYFSHMCKLIYVDFGEDGDVVTYYHPGKKVCVMLVNEQRALKFPKRLNFSLAHELGHLVLKHYEYLDKPGISSEKKELLEYHADEFAAQFLISDYKLMQHKRVKNSILSDYFFVSEEVIRIKKESMGIFSAKGQKSS